MTRCFFVIVYSDAVCPVKGSVSIRSSIIGKYGFIMDLLLMFFLFYGELLKYIDLWVSLV